MFKENYHTHTKYCDGKNTVEEMVESAYKLGFTALGFSGHSYLDFACDWCMTREDTEKYKNEINTFKQQYKGKMDIYCGTELDCYSDTVNPADFDFTIGSVHYIKAGDEYLPVDSSIDEQKKAADKYFGGSLIEYAVAYFNIVADVLDMTGADIIGHFDLVTKFNENDIYFDTKDTRYISAWKKAVDKLIEYKKPFEINTGAIARGVRKTPYPAMDIAKYIDSKGGYFIVTSDCHDCNMLDFGFEEAYSNYSDFRIVSFSDIMRNK